MKDVKPFDLTRLSLIAFIFLGLLAVLVAQQQMTQAKAKLVTHVIQAEVVDEIEWPR